MVDGDNENRGVQNAFAVTSTRELEIHDDACIPQGYPDPCTLVIFGASGDLTARKLVQALYNLYLKKTLPRPFFIFGCSRTEMEDASFREKMRDAISRVGEADISQWESFASLLHYQKVQYDEASSFSDLAKRLMDFAENFHTEGNLIFYLAIPPSLYSSTARMIGEAGLSKRSKGDKGWSRIVVEKPFGRDLATAKDLNRALHKHFEEDQMLFLDQEGVELCWAFLTPILEECETCGGRREILLPYEAGGWGPPPIEAFPNKYYVQK